MFSVTSLHVFTSFKELYVNWWGNKSQRCCDWPVSVPFLHVAEDAQRRDPWVTAGISFSPRPSLLSFTAWGWKRMELVLGRVEVRFTMSTVPCLGWTWVTCRAVNLKFDTTHSLLFQLWVQLHLHRVSLLLTCVCLCRGIRIQAICIFLVRISFQPLSSGLPQRRHILFLFYNLFFFLFCIFTIRLSRISTIIR